MKPPARLDVVVVSPSSRIVRRLGVLDQATAAEVSACLVAMFSP